MPETRKFTLYVEIISGLVFLFFVLTIGFFSVNTRSEPLTSLFSILAYPFLALGLVLIFVGLAGFWANYLRSRKLQLKERARIQDKIHAATVEIQEAFNKIKSSGTYLIYSNKEVILSKINAIRKEIDACEAKKMLKTDFVNKTKEVLDEYAELIVNYNPHFIQQRKADYGFLWCKDKISLDDEQQTAIVTDDKHNLVVAAAGSGKTEVLITRIAYLIRRKPDCVSPNKILAIAYQRKAREQIEQRLQKYGIENVHVKTFHKLGKDILERSDRRIGRTDVVNENGKYNLVKSLFEKEIQTNQTFYRLFVGYIAAIHDKDDEPSEADKNAVVDYAKERSYVSINCTKVNSKAEKEILNCLLTSKINGKPILSSYEPDVDGFRPDFYLTQYDIFIEHWALNKNGEVPEWFSQSSLEYKNTMEKKKRWFAEHGKSLAETFAYEYDLEKPDEFDELLKKRIYETLKKRSPEQSFEFSRLSYPEILELIWKSQKTPIEDIQNFITSAKTYGLSPEQIAEKLDKGKWSNKQVAFGKVALQIFRSYQNQLAKIGKIDFEDMINEAITILDRNKSLCEDIYDQILIDEYQDMSAQRLKLLKKLLERNPDCKLFCVGDDWQSIMGFSGSNLNFFVNFGDYFPNPAITKICTNYRSIKSIVDAGADLIKNNSNCQVQKLALSNRKETKPILVLGSPHQEGFDVRYCEQTAEDCLRRIKEYLEKGYSPNDILVLTRYIRTKIQGKLRYFRIVQTFSDLAKLYDINIAVDNAKEPNAIKLLTVHKCKGLEAKAVFILNVVKGEFGFPSEIEDPSILEIAREANGIQNQKEEERRLFYVALTRAKEDLYIYTRLHEKSEFLNEISRYAEPVRLTY
ncbi:UvrD-helicase domain-containing protein [Candidatus Bathyarchaeota archaeon]|nr:UvrD-helicase domain-containing protein [Candidatus Bathyarchaeota archaeon]